MFIMNIFNHPLVFNTIELKYNHDHSVFDDINRFININSNQNINQYNKTSITYFFNLVTNNNKLFYVRLFRY